MRCAKPVGGGQNAFGPQTCVENRDIGVKACDRFFAGGRSTSSLDHIEQRFRVETVGERLGKRALSIDDHHRDDVHNAHNNASSRRICQPTSVVAPVTANV